MLGSRLVITGSIHSEEDLEIHATIRGQVAAPGHCVQLEGDARIEADILARDITVHGHVNGKLTATEIVDIRTTANVRGHIAAPRLVLEEGGVVNGRIETRSVDAAVRVAQYRKQK